MALVVKKGVISKHLTEQNVVLYLHCIENSVKSFNIQEIPCLNLIYRYGHISFLNSISEKRYAFFANENLEKLQECSSPLLIQVNTCCDIQVMQVKHDNNNAIVFKCI